MTSDEYLQVRGRTIDGQRWHIVVDVDDDGERVTTYCGERYRVDAIDVEISPTGESPAVSGNTICYGCCGVDAVDVAVVDDGQRVKA